VLARKPSRAEKLQLAKLAAPARPNAQNGESDDMPDPTILPSIAQWVFLCSAAVAAGAINAVAGGGTLLTFPTLVWVLGPSAAASVVANATSTVTVAPGSIASAWGYRRELFAMRRWILPLLIPSVLGSYVGSWLVSVRDPEEFQHLVPWLILLATILFLAQPSIGSWIKKLTQSSSEHALPDAGSESPKFGGLQIGVMVFQFFIALYGGYFGAGIGILMLSTLALMGIADIHAMNSLKSLLAGCINAVAVVVFVGVGKVEWRLAIPMIISSILGGFLGAVVARRLDKNVVRWTVITIGISLSGYYFVRTYLG
jgi:uncharacterized membrane protein YfcA